MYSLEHITEADVDAVFAKLQAHVASSKDIFKSLGVGADVVYPYGGAGCKTKVSTMFHHVLVKMRQTPEICCPRWHVAVAVVRNGDGQ